MIARYDKPDHGLLKESHNTYWTTAKLGDNSLLTVPVAAIESGVMMAPNEQIKKACPEKSNTDMWFLVERHGMKLTDASGMMSEEQVDTQEAEMASIVRSEDHLATGANVRVKSCPSIWVKP